jgi:hypothetical protein
VRLAPHVVGPVDGSGSGPRSDLLKGISPITRGIGYAADLEAGRTENKEQYEWEQHAGA